MFCDRTVTSSRKQVQCKIKNPLRPNSFKKQNLKCKVTLHTFSQGAKQSQTETTTPAHPSYYLSFLTSLQRLQTTCNPLTLHSETPALFGAATFYRKVKYPHVFPPLFY